MQQKADEKMDPLMRIQEEIKEVQRREEEYRRLANAAALAAGSPTKTEEAEWQLNGHTEGDKEQQLEAEQERQHDQDQEQDQDHDQERDQGVLVTAQPAAVTSALLLPIEEQSPSNTPSLASSVNSNSHKEESLDEQHSDDSGISASSQKINNINNNNSSINSKVDSKGTLKLTLVGRQESRYIGPNCYNLTPEPPQQKLMTNRTPGTPQQQQQKRQFAFNGSTKGVMQRFIASHGKLQLGNGTPNGMSPAASPLLLATPNSPTLKLNSRNALAFLETGNTSPQANNINNNISNGTLSQGAIERDSEGRPLRRGYVPVEQKIQRELQDLKSRESELKRLRKLNRQYMLEKLQLSTDDEADADDDDDDSEVEHCYGPGKLRNAQSTLELERESNDMELMGYKASGNRSLNAAAVLSNGSGNALSTTGSNSGMRPAMSLAQLCDLTPEEAPSSHRLIAQWESLIKKNAEGTIEAAI
ncbi:probable serine/threonine-protein kinase cdc7 [Drosophila grimshawi]|uniref:GH24126 n=1 Tax=Drosophila grimshawi TaxID=7222 RepID=B4JNK0_DROGR|nr:probable serine/threonine-protein kinase cdc7 [Drosophila grimshawi]XP_032594968.1 probable serine/threonine-protein kinase cdc7 [Drosophila grimshawi]EDV92293.1 GH24126 [Drosophila grimshawi]